MALKLDDRAGNSWDYQGGFFKQSHNEGDPSYEYGYVIIGLGDKMLITLGRDLFVKPLTTDDFKPAAITVITRDRGVGRMIWADNHWFWVTGVEFLSESDGPDRSTIHQFRALLKPA